MIELIGICLLFGLIAGVGYLLHEERILLRELRRLASKYPPFPVSRDEETGDKQGTTSVHIAEEWNDQVPGRD